MIPFGRFLPDNRCMRTVYGPVTLLLLMGAYPAASQLSRIPPASLRTRTVLIPTAVTDRDYHPLLGLSGDQFELRVDHVLTPISGFSRESGPVSAVFVIDTDKTMKHVLQRSREALRGFLKRRD